MDVIEAFWTGFLTASGRGPDTKYLEAFAFGSIPAQGDALLALVLEGRKRATASSLLAYEVRGEAVPRAGDLSIVTDGAGRPRCVIETTAVTVLPFRDMTCDICRREGEDDCLDSWRRTHIRFFREEGAALGYMFSEDMPVVFEDFRVVYQN